jgi:hypothetical protein
MSKDKESKKAAAADEAQEAETTRCPIHRHHTIQLVQQSKKLVGTCQCDVPDNKWLGQVVIEQVIETEE